MKAKALLPRSKVASANGAPITTPAPITTLMPKAAATVRVMASSA